MPLPLNLSMPLKADQHAPFYPFRLTRHGVCLSAWKVAAEAMEEAGGRRGIFLQAFDPSIEEPVKSGQPIIRVTDEKQPELNVDTSRADDDSGTHPLLMSSRPAPMPSEQPLAQQSLARPDPTQELDDLRCAVAERDHALCMLSDRSVPSGRAECVAGSRRRHPRA